MPKKLGFLILNEINLFLYLLKPGIADLNEERPVFLQDVDSGISEIIIRIPDEQYRLWIHLIGKQKLGEKGVVFGKNGECIKIGIVRDILVLDESPDKGPHAEVVYQPHLGQVGREYLIAVKRHVPVVMPEIYIKMSPQVEFDFGILDHVRCQPQVAVVDHIPEVGPHVQAQPAYRLDVTGDLALIQVVLCIGI